MSPRSTASQGFSSCSVWLQKCAEWSGFGSPSTAYSTNGCSVLSQEGVFCRFLLKYWSSVNLKRSITRPEGSAALDSWLQQGKVIWERKNKQTTNTIQEEHLTAMRSRCDRLARDTHLHGSLQVLRQWRYIWSTGHWPAAFPKTSTSQRVRGVAAFKIWMTR